MIKKHHFWLVAFIVFLSGCSWNEFKLNYDSYKEDVKASLYTDDTKRNTKYENQNQKIYESNFQYDKLASLEDENLDSGYGAIGLWIPSKFIKEPKAGIYFLEKYTEGKTPILFVHGAGGHPNEWKTIIANLDKNKFIPMVAFFPSGFNIDFNVKILHKYIDKLKNKYSMKKLIVVAHSMGGLVSKKLVYKLNANDIFVNDFITLSTPWGGHEGAKNSASLDYKIPMWIDLAQKSAYINSLEKIKLDKVDYYLMFGFKGKRTLFNRDNDGTISLQSQLAPYAQEQAIKIYGFNETHVSILRAKNVVNRINQILNSKY